MLLEFKCSNHMSIKDKVTFSMLAGYDHTNEELLKSIGNERVLRSAIIYGPNGSGKTNFLDALAFVKKMVSNSINNQPGDDVLQEPHLLSSADMPSKYEIQFIKKDIRYAYGFSIVKNEVDEEYLYIFPKGRLTKVFERKGLIIYPGDKYKNKFGLSKEALKNNRLFLSCVANYTNDKLIEEGFKFFSKDLGLYNPEHNNWMKYSIKQLEKNGKIKKIFMEFMDALGTGIKDVKAKVEYLSMDNMDIPEGLKEFLQSAIDKSDSESSTKLANPELKVIYDEFPIDIKYESTGIKKLFEVLCPMIDILLSGKILICDELEKSLHESLLYKIVDIFHKNYIEEFAQLIFTTHDTSLLDSDLFRRDQIWFTQLKKGRVTDLYSLAEIKNVRKTENLAKGYIQGKYGAIPLLNNNIEKFFKDK